MKAADLASQDEPFVLDRYQIIGQIASGGMASVSLGRLQGVGGFLRFVAIKRLHPHLAQEPEFVEMFLDEARLAAKIHHQNVVSILEIGESDGSYYLVMEYIEGTTLGRLMARSIARELPIARPVLLRIVVDTLAGLQAAHEAHDELGKPLGIVHRDVSPQNILVGTDGCTRITDFGVARATARLANTRAGSMKGKLAYMAPEQTKGEEVDRRADLFAMGIVLWEVLTGKRLFKGQSEAQTLARVLIDPIPRLKSVLSDVHPALDDVVARSLDRDPDKRYQTAAAMADAIERAARVAEWGRSSMLAQGEVPDSAPVGNVRDVAALVAEVCGDDLSSQREAVRSWLAATPSSTGIRPPPPSGVPAAPRLSAVPASHRSAPADDPSAEGNTIARPPGPPGRVKTPPATRRGWPPPPVNDEGEVIEEGEAGRASAEPPPRTPKAALLDISPATFRSPELAPSRRGAARALPWVLVGAAVLLTAGTVAFLKLRGGAAEGPLPTGAPEPTATATPSATVAAVPSASASTPASPPSATLAPTTSSTPAERPSATTGQRTTSSAPSTQSPPSATVTTAPSAPKKPTEIQDLTNPYH